MRRLRGAPAIPPEHSGKSAYGRGTRLSHVLDGVRYHESVIDTVGRTPLVRLRVVARHCKAPVLAKLEFFNPGGSVKDRIGLAMIEAAERDGKLKPGGTIVECTSGNTGLGLAMVAAVKGYRAVFCMPDKVSSEKVYLLKAFGAEVLLSPTAVAPESPESYYNVAKLLGDVYEGLGLTKDQAQPLAAGVSVFAGFVTELGDGRGHYGFSYEDFVFDVLSAATYLGIAHYGLDDLVGFSIGPLPAPGKPAGCCRVHGTPVTLRYWIPPPPPFSTRPRALSTARSMRAASFPMPSPDWDRPSAPRARR